MFDEDENENEAISNYSSMSDVDFKKAPTKVQKYANQLEVDTTYDDMSIVDVVRSLPAIKSAWLSRYIQEDEHLSKMKRYREVHVEHEMAKCGSVGAQRLSDQDAIMRSSKLQQMDDKIREQKYVVRFLKAVSSDIMKDVTFNINAYKDLMKLKFG